MVTFCFRSLAVTIIAASMLFAQGGTLKVQERAGGGNWRTLQYVKEVYWLDPRPSEVRRLTVQVERPRKVLVEVKTVGGLFNGHTWTLTSDGESAWIYDSAQKGYAQLPAPPDPSALLATLDWSSQTSWRANTYVFGSNYTFLVEPGRLFEDAASRDVETLTSETIKVGGRKYDCVVVKQGSSRNWVDKTLMISLKRDQNLGWSTIPCDECVSNRVLEEYLQQTKSLKVDEPIAASTFTFTPPAGSSRTLPPAYVRLR